MCSPFMRSDVFIWTGAESEISISQEAVYDNIGKSHNDLLGNSSFYGLFLYIIHNILSH